MARKVYLVLFAMLVLNFVFFGMPGRAFANESAPAEQTEVTAEQLLSELPGNPLATKAVYDLAEEYWDKKQYDEAKLIYQYIIDNGTDEHYMTASQISLVMSDIPQYLDAEGTRKNKHLAKLWFRKAIDTGENRAKKALLKLRNDQVFWPVESE